MNKITHLNETEVSLHALSIYRSRFVLAGYCRAETPRWRGETGTRTVLCIAQMSQQADANAAEKLGDNKTMQETASCGGANTWKSDIPIHDVAAGHIPYIRSVCHVPQTSDCIFFPLWGEQTQSQVHISAKHLSECLHRHISYPSAALGSRVGTWKYNNPFKSLCL